MTLDELRTKLNFDNLFLNNSNFFTLILKFVVFVASLVFLDSNPEGVTKQQKLEFRYYCKKKF